MYYIIHTNTLYGAGGHVANAKIYKKSSDEQILKDILADLCSKALESDAVEAINYVAIEDFVSNDIQEKELLIEYYSDGLDFERDEYYIVSDDEVEDETVKELIRLKEERNRFLTIAYNAICLGQLDEQMSVERLLEELGCTEEEWNEIMN